MSRRLKQVGIVLAVIFVAAQLVRPGRTNPATDPTRTIQAHVGTATGLVAVLDRACGDCHSNRTVWPWYTQVAPVSWLMAYGVRSGRNAVNFSEWAAYPPGRQRELLDLTCRDVSQGKMPGSAWIMLHPEARLSAQDIRTICAAAGAKKSVTRPELTERIVRDCPAAGDSPVWMHESLAKGSSGRSGQPSTAGNTISA